MKVYWHFPTFDPALSYFQVPDNMVRALLRKGVDVVPLPPDTWRAPGYLQALMAPDLGGVPTVAMATPDFYCNVAVGRVWIFTMYESTVLPDGWADTIVRRGERLLVPSAWCQELFESHMRRFGPRLGADDGPVQTIPTHVVPLGVDPGVYVYVDRPARDTYTFLTFADRASRKGWDLVWRAFFALFGDRARYRDVRLILKMTDRPGSVAYNVTGTGDTRVRIWREDSHDLTGVFQAVDCLLYPTRGEGFGLPPREAAATGLPVVCTHGMGCDDVPNWGLPVRYRWGKTGDPSYDGQWMQPDYDEFVFWMEWCYRHRDQARAFGRRAADWIHTNCTWARAADIMIDLLRQHGGY